jgi:hypothetical protein
MSFEKILIEVSDENSFSTFSENKFKQYSSVIAVFFMSVKNEE